LIKEHEEAIRVMPFFYLVWCNQSFWLIWSFASLLIKEAEKEVAAALAERDKAIDDLQKAESRHGDEVEAR
jgi:hypothetical protein